MSPSHSSKHTVERTSTETEDIDVPVTSEYENGAEKDSEEVKTAERKAWPENFGRERNIKRWLLGIYNRWSYSYMNPVLRKGRRQFKDGEHLLLEDLYEVPDDMRSELLVERFW